MSTPTDHRPLLNRFVTYQKERFPLVGHGILIAVFTFSAIAYSRLCRGAETFIEWPLFLVGYATTFTLFFLLRVLDEFKDREEDALYRQQLPVPRGVITLRELGWIGGAVFAVQLLLNLLFVPQIWYLYVAVLVYLALMTREFFVPGWLKGRPFWYVVSHMMIIPLVDTYASGLDWAVQGAGAPLGLLLFFGVSFMNGIVLEVGRKIRTPEQEEVNTYSSKLGMPRATWLWLSVLLATLALSCWAAFYVASGFGYIGALIGVWLLCTAVGLVFLKKQTARGAKLIEHASALWTISMYLILGGIPMLVKILT